MAEAEPGQASANAKNEIGQGRTRLRETSTEKDPSFESGSSSSTEIVDQTPLSPAPEKPAAGSESAEKKSESLKKKPIWWDTEKAKLDGDEDVKRALLVRFVGPNMLTREEFSEQISEATYWLADRPHRRGRSSRLDRFLVTWLTKAVQDKRSGEVAKKRIDDRRGTGVGRVQPRPAQRPEEKWCVECRENLPNHAEWCPKKGK